MNTAYIVRLAGHPVIHLSPEQEALAIWFWTIYWNSRDHPGQYVVRKHGNYLHGQIVAAEPLYIGGDLCEARWVIPPGAVNIGRMAEDDPVIEEVWI